MGGGGGGGGGGGEGGNRDSRRPIIIRNSDGIGCCIHLASTFVPGGPQGLSLCYPASGPSRRPASHLIPLLRQYLYQIRDITIASTQLAYIVVI